MKRSTRDGNISCYENIFSLVWSPLVFVRHRKSCGLSEQHKEINFNNFGPIDVDHFVCTIAQWASFASFQFDLLSVHSSLIKCRRSLRQRVNAQTGTQQLLLSTSNIFWPSELRCHWDFGGVWTWNAFGADNMVLACIVHTHSGAKWFEFEQQYTVNLQTILDLSCYCQSSILPRSLSPPFSPVLRKKL